MAPSRRNGPSNDENPDIDLISLPQNNCKPHTSSQSSPSTNNVNNANANGGNGRNGGNGVRGEERGREAAIGMSWVDFKALLVEEFCPSNEIEKLESKFWNHTMVRANHAGYTDRFHELAKLVTHLVTPESKRIGRYINGLPPQIRGMLQATQPTTIQSAILKAVILTDEAIRCGTLTRSSEKKRKWKKKVNKEVDLVCCVITVKNWVTLPEIVGHWLDMWRQLALSEWKIIKGKLTSFGGQPKHPEECFISTKFAPLLNVKPSIVSLGYIIEVANDKKKEVDRIIRDCKLELGNSLFTIDLIPLGHGSFDVIVGIEWLSKNKAEIVCHEKVVRIQLESGEILHVQGEHNLGGTKTLMSTQQKNGVVYIPIVLDFIEVFPERLVGITTATTS
ncbi:reverse transcriptase domain-containing protein [Tanacetum coccineum]